MALRLPPVHSHTSNPPVKDIRHYTLKKQPFEK
jgi:hypothetical protein